MTELRILRHLFRVQLRTRGLIAAGVTAALLLAFGIVTADFTAWWFDGLPWLKPTSTWIKSQDSWDLFIYVFIGVTVIAYVQQLSSVFLDRHNGNVLVRLSHDEVEEALQSSDISSATKPSALLGARRRALESLFRADPGVYSLVTLIVALVILGHLIAAIVMACFGAFVLLYFPRMLTKFSALKEPQEGEETSSPDENDDEPSGTLGLPSELDDPSPATESLTLEEQRALRKARRAQRAARRADSQGSEDARAARARERAEKRLSLSAERMFIIINRPIVRLKIGWPVIVGGLVAVASVASLTISDMAGAGELPQRGTLLILLLVLVSRSCISLAQYWEELAFFVASLSHISESETGRESL